MPLALSTRLPYVPLRLPAVTAAPSAPCTSLVMTLPIRLRLFSLAVFGLVSFTAVGPSSSKRKTPLAPKSKLALALSPSASVTVCTRVSTPAFRVRLTLSSRLSGSPCQRLSSRARVTAPLAGLMVKVK
ncbi:hypothetical protein D3C85_1078290 [compost metagenome]